MPISHNLDIRKRSIWKFHTPNIQTRKLPFYINEIGLFECNSGFFTKRSGQRNFELLYTLEGKGEVTIGKTTDILSANKAAIIDCLRPNHYRTSGDFWRLFWVHFNGIGARTYFEAITKSSPFISPRSTEEFLSYCYQLLGLDPGQNLNVSFEASRLLLMLLTDLYFGSQNTAQWEKTTGNELSEVIDYISTHYMNTITLDEMCKRVHLSKYYFINVFKSYTGSTPHEYIINCRLGHAKELLRKTTLSIKEICSAVGFSDESYFIKTFRKQNNITPNQYRIIG